MRKHAMKEPGRHDLSASEAMPSVPADPQHAPAIGEDFSHLSDTVDALLVVDGHFDYFEMQLVSAEKKFVISPSILNAPRAEMGLHAKPIIAPENFCAAQRVFKALIEEEGKEQAEKFVAKQVG
jgi:hypothetical protein